MQPGNRDHLLARESDKETIILTRKEEKDLLVVVMNFSEKNFQKDISGLENSRLELLLYSAHKDWGGNISNDTMPFHFNDKKFVANLAERSLAIFKASK